jgi:hypothetical protein
MASAMGLGSIDFSSFQVGDCPCDLQDTVMSSGSHALLYHCAFQQLFAVGGELAEGTNLTRSHLSGAIDRAFHVAKKKIVPTAIRELA